MASRTSKLNGHYHTVPQPIWQIVYARGVLHGESATEIIRAVKEKYPEAKCGIVPVNHIVTHPEWDSYKKYVDGVKKINDMVFAARKKREAALREKSESQIEKNAEKRDLLDLIEINEKHIKELEKRLASAEVEIDALTAKNKQLETIVLTLKNNVPVIDLTPRVTYSAASNAKSIDIVTPKKDNKNNVHSEETKFKPVHKDSSKPRSGLPWWK